MLEYTNHQLLLMKIKDELCGGNAAELARKLERDESYVNRLFYPKGKSGGKGVGLKIMEAANKAFAGQLPLGYWDMDPSSVNLLAGATATDAVRVVEAVDVIPQPGYIRLEHLSPEPSMGRGYELDDPTHIVQYLDVLEDWVRRKIGVTDPRRIKVLTGIGRSMRPTIEDEDLVFVDTGCCEIDHPDIYVIAVGKRLLLKRALILVADQTLVLRSDNADEFPDEERIPLKTSESIHVAGRVKAWWTLRR